MIKKIIPFILATSFLSSSASAEEENNFYLKGGIGLNHINTVKFSNHDFDNRGK